MTQKALCKFVYSTEDEVLNAAKSIMENRIQHHDLLNSPNLVVSYLTTRLGHREREVFLVLYLNNQNQLISSEELFLGTIDGAAVYPREVVKSALKHNSAALIIAHNHPSGIAEPSQADRNITSRLQEALSLVEIRVLDHVVIGSSNYVSFAERGLI